MPASAIRSYLSGLVIGHEIEAAAPPSGSSVLLLGNEELCGLYAKLLARKGVSGVPGPAEAATLGHYRIWQALSQ
jgi:2-dehydro-3-deoxygalactonokinase